MHSSRFRLGWREQLPEVELEFHGKVSADLSRQEARALKRKVAKITATQAKQRGRQEAALDRKSRRAAKRRVML